MKFISWNINGLRGMMKKGGLSEFVAREKADAYMFQEVKMSEVAMGTFDHLAAFPGYHAYWNVGVRPGYSGLLTLIKESSLPVTKGMS